MSPFFVKLYNQTSLFSMKGGVGITIDGKLKLTWYTEEEMISAELTVKN